MEKEFFKKILNKLLKSFSVYWSAYGGWTEFFRSPYLYIALILTVFTIIFADEATKWKDTAINAIPDMLGFTLGGYAMLLGFSDNEFLRKLLSPNECSSNCDYESRVSPYMQISGAFCHFIVIQTATLAYAYICTAFKSDNLFVVIIGNFLLFYTFSLVIAATFAVLHFSDCYDVLGGNVDKPRKLMPVHTRRPYRKRVNYRQNS